MKAQVVNGISTHIHHTGLMIWAEVGGERTTSSPFRTILPAWDRIRRYRLLGDGREGQSLLAAVHLVPDERPIETTQTHMDIYIYPNGVLYMYYVSIIQAFIIIYNYINSVIIIVG